ncbi:MAG TPA: hypothetical protein VJC21_01175 [Candidatus Nanoarchaeia archaeon]|nr:hypothetical protein [Candidatus Nanoarchaeia archaeon]
MKEEKIVKYTQEHINWKLTADPTQPYQTEVRGTVLRVRLNDFPDESLYTLLVNGTAVQTLEEWPSTWERERLPYTPEKVASVDDMLYMVKIVAAEDTEDSLPSED